MSDEARRVIAEADEHSRIARAAETARSKIRLGEKPVARRGLIVFRRQRPGSLELEFTADETAAIYRALAQIRDEARASAARLNATVRVDLLASRAEAEHLKLTVAQEPLPVVTPAL